MTGRAVYVSYARSLAWFAVWAAIAGAIGNIVELLLIDFVHGNPHRSRENAVAMMLMFTPLLGLFVMVVALVTFALPQLIQAAVSCALASRLGSRAHTAILLALPMTTVVTWYSIDYITMPILSPDTEPYQHGLTMARYLAALVLQATATVFNVAYLRVAVGRVSWKVVAVLSIVTAVVVGSVWGHHLASGQFQFL
jgi:hypothetical protein